MIKVSQVLFASAMLLFSVSGFGEETKMEKAEIAKDRAVDQTKKSYREMKDKGCEMFNGKMECKTKKAMNKMRDATDKAKTDAKEAIDKQN